MPNNLEQLIAELLRDGKTAAYVSCSRDFKGTQQEALRACELAALANRTGAEAGWRIWGVTKKSHKIVGAQFNPDKPYRKGLTYAQWMAREIGEGFTLTFLRGIANGKRVVVMSATLATPALDSAAAQPSETAEASTLSAEAPDATISGNQIAEKTIHENAPESWATDLRRLRSIRAEGQGGLSAKPDLDHRLEKSRAQQSEASLKPRTKIPSAADLAASAYASSDGTEWLDSATDKLDAMYVLNVLDWETSLRARSMPIPDQLEGITDLLQRMGYLVSHDGGKTVSVTNLGALTTARDLRMFDKLDRLAIQVVAFRGAGRAEVIAMRRFDTGYALAIDEACAWAQSFFAESGDSWDANQSPYPMAALREIVVNAVSHQDLSTLGNLNDDDMLPDASGADLINQPAFVGPLIEVFSNRIEVSNTGTLNVSLPHIPNASLRNKTNPMAQTLRSFRSRPTPHSGWSSILESCDLHQAPVPLFSSSAAAELKQLEFARKPEVSINQMSISELLDPDSPSTRGLARSSTTNETTGASGNNVSPGNRVCVTMQPISPFKDLSQEQRLVATYWHAFSQLSRDDYLTNGSLRARFDVKETNAAQISRLIKDAALHGLIRVTDPNAAPKYKRYVPYWA